jgi:hypothetical protein
MAVQLSTRALIEREVMAKFSKSDGVEDMLTDAVGLLARQLQECKKYDLKFRKIRAEFDKKTIAYKYFFFEANVTNYGTWSIGESKLFYVPLTRKGALSIFRDKTIRLVCVGSGRFTRGLAAKEIKLNSVLKATVIENLKLNQEKIAKEM